MCSITNFGNTVLKYLPADNAGESDIFNHFLEFRETSGARAIVSVIMGIVGNVGKPNIFHESVGFTNISNNFHELGETSGAKAIVNRELGDSWLMRQ